MIPKGYVLRARKVEDSDLALCPPCAREMFELFVRQAAFQPKVENGVRLARGQLMTGYRQIREDLRWLVGGRVERYPESQVEAGVKTLKNKGMITATKTAGGMIVSVTNYETYQNPDNYENRAAGDMNGGMKTARPGTRTPHLLNKEEELRTKNQEKKKEGERAPKAAPCPHSAVIGLYHEILPELPKVVEWSEPCRKALGARWREKPERQNLDWWRGYFENEVKPSDFLMGRTKEPFTCTLLWLIGPQNMAKVLNGQYKNREKPKRALNEFDELGDSSRDYTKIYGHGPSD